MNRILVVDDDTAIRLLYSDDLSEEGYEVVTGTGREGLMELIEKKRPDLVVLDMSPGDHDGMGICQDIRKTYDDLPVILSGVYETERLDVPPPAAEGACASMSWDLRELKRAIQMAVKGRSQRLGDFMSQDLEEKRHGSGENHVSF